MPIPISEFQFRLNLAACPWDVKLELKQHKWGSLKKGRKENILMIFHKGHIYPQMISYTRNHQNLAFQILLAGTAIYKSALYRRVIRNWHLVSDHCLSFYFLIECRYFILFFLLWHFPFTYTCLRIRNVINLTEPNRLWLHEFTRCSRKCSLCVLFIHVMNYCFRTAMAFFPSVI